MSKIENVVKDSTKLIKNASKRPKKNDIIRTNNELTRICPNCQKEIWHKSAKSRYNSEWAGVKCISCKNSGKNNPFYGKTHTDAHKQTIRDRVVSDETKNKISNKNIGKVISTEQRRLARYNALYQFNGPRGIQNRRRMSEIQRV